MLRLTLMMQTAAVMLVATAGIQAAVLTDPPGELSPISGNISGYDGDTVTWGLILDNNTNDPSVSAVPEWWVITGVIADYSYFGLPGDVPNGPNFFTDLLTPYFFNNFFLNNQSLAPGQDLNLNSPGSPVDLASFSISPTAAATTISAQLHIFYDIWDSNPFDPTNLAPNQLGSDQFDVNTSVTSLGPNPNGNPASSAPEPDTVSLMFSAAVAGVLLLFRTCRQTNLDTRISVAALGARRQNDAG